MTAGPKKRCEWVNGDDPLMVDYHDREWGVPVHDDRKHFEFLVLEAAQGGAQLVDRAEEARGLSPRVQPLRSAQSRGLFRQAN
jgi:DNA-3-methyladenine glycosylase I